MRPTSFVPQTSVHTPVVSGSSSSVPHRAPGVRSQTAGDGQPSRVRPRLLNDRMETWVGAAGREEVPGFQPAFSAIEVDRPAHPPLISVKCRNAQRPPPQQADQTSSSRSARVASESVGRATGNSRRGRRRGRRSRSGRSSRRPWTKDSGERPHEAAQRCAGAGIGEGLSFPDSLRFGHVLDGSKYRGEGKGPKSTAETDNRPPERRRLRETPPGAVVEAGAFRRTPVELHDPLSTDSTTWRTPVSSGRKFFAKNDAAAILPLVERNRSDPEAPASRAAMATADREAAAASP